MAKITVIKNGPLIVESEDTLTVDGELKGKKQAFCRCGKSTNGIYCDGSHKSKNLPTSSEGSE